MKRIPFLGLTAALAAIVAVPVAQAEQANRTCVTTAEAEALFLFVAPEMLQRAGQLCSANLPQNAMLRRLSTPFLAKYQAESRGAWPAAKRAIAKIQPEASSMLDSDFAAPLVGTMMTELLVKEIRGEDCPTINRAVTLMEPLPARNLAGLAVLFAQVATNDERSQVRNRVPSRLRICPVAA